jgi:hypothetical protein
MKKLTILAAFCCTTTVLFSQNRLSNDTKGIIYNTEKAFDARLYSFGWGFATNAYFGNIRTYNRTTYYSVGLGFDLKHPKESPKSTDFSSGAPSSGFRKYAFGKQNYAVALRGGYGFKRYYSEKASKNGVALALNVSGGATAALVIPYYLEIGVSRTDQNKVVSTKYSPETEKLFLEPNIIRGKSNFFKGIGETKVIPGVYGQAGIHLDWGAFDEFLRAAEIGIQVDIYAKKIPIMVESAGVSNRPFFFNLYLSLQLGKRN